MKKVLFLIHLFVLFGLSAQVGIGTTSPDNSSVLDVVSTDSGVLLPRMTEDQRDAISNPAKGLLIYNLTCDTVDVNTGTPSSPKWVNLNPCSSATPVIIRVGTETHGSTINSNIPAKYSSSSFDKIFSWSTSIYQNTDLNQSGNITKLEYLVDGRVTGACTGVTVPNQKIYMKMIDAANTSIPLSIAPTPADLSNTWIQVFDGAIRYDRGVSGTEVFSTIELTTPFTYDNTKDLLIHIENRSSGYIGAGSCHGSFSETPSYIMHVTTPNTSIYGSYDSGDPSSNSASTENKIPVTRFYIGS